MNLLCRILFLLSAANAALAVDFPLRWRWSNPSPHGGNVVDMAYSTTLGLAVQVAERGQIYTSGDLDIWLPRESNTTKALRGVCFLGQRIIITGENGTVLYADDVAQFQTGTNASGPTTVWLEAVTASATLAVAAGDSGEIYTSSNGATWYRQTSGSSTWFRGAAYGNGTFVVVGENGGILTSPNGTNWAVRTGPTSRHLNRVGFGLGRFTAVGDSGVTIATTNNGASWFSEVTGATNALQCAVTGGTQRLVDGSYEVRLQNGLGWSDELAQSNGPPGWTYYTALGLPGFFLIAGQTGLQSEGYQSSTNYFWLMPYNSVRNWLWDLKRLPGLYVGVGDFGTIMTSGNGVDWTLELVPSAATNTTFLGVGGTTNMLLAAGESGAVLCSPNVLTDVVITNASGVITQTVSTIGVVWHPIPTFTGWDLQGVGVLSNSLFVVGGGQGSIFTSPDGTNWTSRSSGTTNLISSISDWPGGLMACGDRGTLLRSANGLAWSKITTGTTNWLYRVRWLNNTLLVMGQGGTLLTSADGLTWSNRTSGVTSWLTDASFIGDTWLVVGLSGTVLSSSNLVNWVNRGTITKKALYAAATDAAQLVTVGVEGVILRSQVLPDLTPVSFLNYARETTNGPPYYNVYLFGGKPDQRFTLDRATNVVSASWTTGPLLEILDGSGALYFVETLYATNQPATEFYRTRLAP